MKRLKGYVEKYLKEVDEDGFSLLELVVAVGILLVLTVGGLLAYSGLTKNARVAAVQAAAAEVYTGAVAYDSNGENYKKAETDWMDSSKKGSANSITVEIKDKNETNGELCVEAVMDIGADTEDIKASKGPGCDNAGGSTKPGTGGNEGGSDDDLIVPPATAAGCFKFAAGVITGYNAGDDCPTDVVIPNTIRGEAVVGIGRLGFHSNRRLTSVVIPGSVKTIGNDAFDGNTLESVEFNEGLETIGDYAFSNNKLTGHIDFPSSLKSIGANAFRYNNLTSVSVSKNTALSPAGRPFDLGVSIIRY